MGVVIHGIAPNRRNAGITRNGADNTENTIALPPTTPTRAKAGRLAFVDFTVVDEAIVVALCSLVAIVVILENDPSN